LEADFSAQAPETARANINLETLRPLLLPNPSYDKQIKFAQLYQSIYEIKAKQMLYCDDLFKSIQHRAFKGEL
jgi:type I restriction enzyme S subunit